MSVVIIVIAVRFPTRAAIVVVILGLIVIIATTGIGIIVDTAIIRIRTYVRTYVRR